MSDPNQSAVQQQSAQYQSASRYQEATAYEAFDLNQSAAQQQSGQHQSASQGQQSAQQSSEWAGDHETSDSYQSASRYQGATAYEAFDLNQSAAQQQSGQHQSASQGQQSAQQSSEWAGDHETSDSYQSASRYQEATAYEAFDLNQSVAQEQSAGQEQSGQYEPSRSGRSSEPQVAEESSEWAGDSAPTEPLRTTRRAKAARPEASSSAGSERWQRRSSSEEPLQTSGLRSSIVKRIGIGVGALIAVLGLAYVADLVLSSGHVPRGVVVAGIEIGGKDTDAADAQLRTELGPRADQELPLQIGDVQTRLTPTTAGLAMDWDRTWARIGSQPLNPITRLTSLFTTHTVPVASTVDDNALDTQLTALRVHDRATVEGTIAFDGARAVAVPPVPGRVLDVPAARAALIDNWYLGALVDLPETAAPIAVRPEAVQQALHDIAEPAVRAPIVFAGKNNATGKLEPEQIASVLAFAPDGQGGLAATFKQDVVLGVLGPQLAPSEVEAKDATFALTGAKPTVVPAVIGDKINWAKTLEQLSALIVAPQERTGQAVYEKVDPKLTTEAANALGITEMMGQFTTSGFSGPSGVNIRVVARKVNGAIVKPGETFSLNDFTGPRGTAEGYVESGIIDHGRPSTAVGGGISQFATTLYNAAYFAGMEDAGHTEHSYYISRYPAAREATVFDGVIDLKFRNNGQTGVYIETSTTDSEVTVRLWGTKTVNVESITGEKTKPTEPTEIKLPKGKDCIATEGAPGFTISDTRVITDSKTGRQISRTTRTVKYDPIPVVKCE